MHAVGDRVLGQGGEVRQPVRIHTPDRVAVSPHPIQKLNLALVLGHLSGPVQRHKTTATLHLHGELLKVIPLQCRMHGKPIRINQNGVSGFDLFFRGPFRIQMHLHIHQIRHPGLETFRQQLDARVVFVSSGTVALLSSNEHDVLFLSGRRGELNERQSEDD